MTSPQTTTAKPIADAKRGAGIYLALAPWVLFSLVARESVQFATVLALVASVVIAAPAVLAGKPKAMNASRPAAIPRA